MLCLVSSLGAPPTTMKGPPLPYRPARVAGPPLGLVGTDGEPQPVLDDHFRVPLASDKLNQDMPSEEVQASVATDSTYVAMSEAQFNQLVKQQCRRVHPRHSYTAYGRAYVTHDASDNSAQSQHAGAKLLAWHEADHSGFRYRKYAGRYRQRQRQQSQQHLSPHQLHSGHNTSRRDRRRQASDHSSNSRRHHHKSSGTSGSSHKSTTRDISAFSDHEDDSTAPVYYHSDSDAMAALDSPGYPGPGERARFLSVDHMGYGPTISPPLSRGGLRTPEKNNLISPTHFPIRPPPPRAQGSDRQNYGYHHRVYHNNLRNNNNNNNNPWHSQGPGHVLQQERLLEAQQQAQRRRGLLGDNQTNWVVMNG